MGRLDDVDATDEVELLLGGGAGGVAAVRDGVRCGWAGGVLLLV